jgi:hypothetical protein
MTEKIEETEEIEETKNEKPHPGDLAHSLFAAIIEYEGSIKGKNNINLKFELLNNIIPIIKKQVEIMADFIDMVDDDLYEHDDEDVIEDGIQETVEKSLELSKEIDDLKIAIDTCTDPVVKKLLSDKVQKLSEWSEQVKKTVSEVVPEEYVADSGKVVPLIDEDPSDKTSEVSNG